MADNDAVVKDFERGLKAFHKGDYDASARHFRQLIEKTDQSGMVARARTYLELSESRSKPAVEVDVDPYMQAVVAKNDGDFDAAMELCSRGGRKGKDGRFAFLAASVHALREETEEALEALTAAIDLDATSRVHAFHDVDFQGLRDEPRFRELLGLD